MANLNNIIKILVIVIIIMIAVVIIYMTTMNDVNEDTLERVNLSETCSLELPNVNFDEKNATNEVTYNGITIKEYNKNLTSDKLCIQYTQSHDKTDTNESNVSEKYSIQSNTNWHTRTVFNSTTGESIIISGENKELVDKIAASVVFNQINTTTNKTKDTATSSASSSASNINSNSSSGSNSAEEDAPFSYYGGKPVTEEEYNQIYNSQPHPDVWFEYHPDAPNPHEPTQ